MLTTVETGHELLILQLLDKCRKSLYGNFQRVLTKLFGLHPSPMYVKMWHCFGQPSPPARLGEWRTL